MALRTVIEVPDPRLRQLCDAVEDFGEPLQSLATDLTDTLAALGGIGLCAPQIGAMQRVIVVHVPGDAYGLQVYVNPEVMARSTPGFIAESCLSVPGIEGNVMRSTRVCLKAQGLDGEVFERDIDGIHAVCVQHEIDHLNGILFTDRLSWLKKLRLRLAERKAARTAEAA